MFCPRCGAHNSDDSNFCTFCGSALPKNKAQNNGQYNGGTYTQNEGAEKGNPYPHGYRANVTYRSIATCIILSILTCGIYYIVWAVMVIDDLNFASGRQNESNGFTVWLLGLVTCGIYTLFWLYNAGAKVGEVQRRSGLYRREEGDVYLILALFGLGIVAYAMIQNELNKVAAIV